MSPATLALTFDEVEREQEKHDREVQRLLLQAHLQQRGLGDVGAAIAVTTKDGAKTKVRHHGQRRLHQRRILSIFGAIPVTRMAYHADEAESLHPLDEAASFPKRTFSHEVQRRLVVGSIQGPFDESLERVKESTGLVVSKLSAEQILRDAAQDFDAFYDGKNRKLPPPSKLGSILVAAVDCKGVPMVKPEQALRVVRRGRGKKANKKRMATVAAVFTHEPRVRTPEEVVASLFDEGPHRTRGKDEASRWPGPEHKRVWASLERSKDDVIDEVVREVARRDPCQKKKLAVVIDGERALVTRTARKLKGAIQILDVIHALEKIWKCAYCFHKEGSEEAKAWVRKYALEIMRGRVSQVIKGIRSSATKQGIKGLKRKMIDQMTSYLYRNRKRMRYDDYLKEGLPIASGSVEGACKNLVKARMERSGMRWTLETGEAMLRVRAIYLSGDFEEYWRFHMDREHARLYSSRTWGVTAK